MESRDYKEGFEDFLQEKADQYKLYPSDRVWNAINNKLHPRTKWSYLVVAAMFLGLGIGGKVYDSSFARELVAQQNVNDRESADQQLSDNSLVEDLAPVVPINSGSRSSFSTSNNQNTSSAVTSPGYSVTQMETRVVPLFATESDGISGLIINDENDQPGHVVTSQDQSVSAASGHDVTGNEILDETAVHDVSETGGLHAKSMASITATQFSGIGRKDLAVAKIPAPEKASSIKVLKPRHLNIGWQLYASPTVSYRKLSGEGMSYYNSSSLSSVFSPDVEKSVRHKPSVGFELGTALTYATGPNFRFKTGLQLNINRYEVQAYSYVPEVAPMTQSGIGHTTINAISTYRNYNGFSKTWLKNQHIMMSIPLGAELTLFGGENVKFNIGGTLQPTYVLNNQAYMISTNMKNYAQEPSLYKRFNVAAGAEAYVSIKSGSYKWMIGPQFRYQIFSSYKKEYPITEHLTDYGFKIGISR
ncbi:MAG TPA: hypothetical protein VK166_09040 [Chitinophagaceae bacterium]|nr:hypothetical protein [Chitinophagaceae bacterium]